LAGRFDVLLFTDQRANSILDGSSSTSLPPTYRAGIGEQGLSAVWEFVRQGGTVVALGAEVGGVLAVGAELVRLEVAGEGDQEVKAAPREALASSPVAPTPLPTPAPAKPVVAEASAPSPRRSASPWERS